MLVHAHADQPHADTTPRLPANCLVLPFWQVNREDIALRQEATWMFESIMHQSGDAIARQIFCLDDLPLLRSMCQTHKSFGGWILCDHNVPTLSFTDTDTVLAIVDHHVDGNAFLDARPRITSMIGSTCSHVCNLYQRNEVGRSFFASQSSINSSNEHNALVFLQSLSPVAAMLLCTILLDTSNNMGRSDDDRAAMIACLKTSSMTALAASESSLFESERSNLFDLLLKLRRDVMGLTCPQLLRKDFKVQFYSFFDVDIFMLINFDFFIFSLSVSQCTAVPSQSAFPRFCFPFQSWLPRLLLRPPLPSSIPPRSRLSSLY
jgi:hypothetical protein